jgi:hypothetical protein
VIRPFGLNDVLLVRQLQRTSAALAVEHILTHPRAPLWIALTAPWPWAGVGVATYVLSESGNDGRLVGFVQLVKRDARPEADILHIAPALAVADGRDQTGEAIWDRLLAYCTRAAGGYGLQRIFASIPDGGLEEHCLRAAGYSLYTRETIYRLAVVPQVREVPPGFRPQLPQDSWALQRLYTRGTPRLVQQAEGALTGEVGSPPLSWWEPDRWHGIAWEPAGEVRGAVQIHIGRAGHWLRVWGTNTLASRELRSLLEQGLRAIDGDSPGRRQSRPVYVTVRDYEVGLSSVLTGFGFAPYASRARFVRHTTATVLRATARAVAQREVRQEVPVRSEALSLRLACAGRACGSTHIRPWNPIQERCIRSDATT